MEKREIKSVAELVNALEEGVKVCVTVDDGYYPFELSMKTALSSYEQGVKFNYSEPVEVVELWGYENTRSRWWTNKDDDAFLKPFTHKQTQIIQNEEVIWTETTKIK